MARTTIEQKALDKAHKIGRLIGMNGFAVIGRLVTLWNASQDEGKEFVSREWIEATCLYDVRRKVIKEKFFARLIDNRFLEKMENDTFRIKGNSRHIANLISYKERTKPARLAKLKHANCVVQTQLYDTKSVVIEETREVIHSDDGNPATGLKVDENSKQDEFKKTPVNRPDDRTVNSAQLQVQVQEQGINTDLFSSEERVKNPKKKNNKKKKGKDDDSTNFVYCDSKPTSAASASYFNAAYKAFKGKFETLGVTMGAKAESRYRELIEKEKITHEQIMAMIENYANYILPQVKPGFNPVKRKFETFLGTSQARFCFDYLEPVMMANSYSQGFDLGKMRENARKLDAENDQKQEQTRKIEESKKTHSNELRSARDLLSSFFNGKFPVQP